MRKSLQHDDNYIFIILVEVKTLGILILRYNKLVAPTTFTFFYLIYLYTRLYMVVRCI